jgi:hypothetical protein
MARLRFSIRSLVLFVVTCALGFGALRNASELVATAVSSLVLLFLATGTLGIFLQRGERRARWIGLVVFGAGYFALTFGPWDASHLLISSSSLDKLNLVMNPPVIRYKLQVETGFAPTVIFEDTAAEKVDARLAAMQQNWDPSKKWYVTAGDGKVLKSGFPDWGAAQEYFGEALAKGISVGAITHDPDPSKVTKSSEVDYSRSREVADSFTTIGHGIICLLLALFGASIARWLYATRDSGNCGRADAPVNHEAESRADHA